MPATLKADPTPIIRAHFRSYRSARDGSRQWIDYVVFVGIPFAVFGACAWLGVELSTGISVGLLTVSGLLGAFLFQVMLQILERATSWADSAPAQGRETTKHAMLLEELAANAGYASLISIAAAIAFVTASTTSHWALRLSSAAGLALGAHLVLVLLMVMKRVFAVIQERLKRARTGADQGPSFPADRERSIVTRRRAS
jgi:hypothetical protein